MDLILPKFGLFFWTLIFFLTFFILLRKFAWKPILDGLRKREETIANSLEEAKKAREEMDSLKAENEMILKEARMERDKIIKESREMGDAMVSKAKAEAQETSAQMIEAARREIQAEKMAAMTEIKNEVGKLSIEIAEKLIKKELEKGPEQERIIEGLIGDLKLN